MSEADRCDGALFLVRHGHVHNPHDLAYGHLPRFRLDAEGRAQAARAGAWLGRAGLAALVTSPLLRARQTARIIRETTGPLPLRVDRRLRESELARFWQGLAWDEIAREHETLYGLFATSPSRITTGETMTAMAARMLAACRAAVRRHPGERVALVSHRDPILALRLTLMRGDLDGLHRTLCRQGSITVLYRAADEFRVEDYIEPRECQGRGRGLSCNAAGVRRAPVRPPHPGGLQPATTMRREMISATPQES